jgi:uncharacterized lipoprotein YbaY
MLTWLIKNRLAAFERRFGYDASYLRHVLEVDPAAFWAFAKVQKMSRYHRDVPRTVQWAAGITASMAKDCGPCTQLGVAMALADGCSATVLGNVIAGDDIALPDDVRLGVQFARAALAHAPEADALREEIERRWGKRAVVSLAMAVTCARIWPTFKYALGFGKACTRVTVGEKQIVPRRARVAA